MWMTETMNHYLHAIIYTKRKSVPVKYWIAGSFPLTQEADVRGKEESARYCDNYVIANIALFLFSNLFFGEKE